MASTFRNTKNMIIPVKGEYSDFLVSSNYADTITFDRYQYPQKYSYISDFYTLAGNDVVNVTQ